MYSSILMDGFAMINHFVIVFSVVFRLIMNYNVGGLVLERLFIFIKGCSSSPCGILLKRTLGIM